MQLIAYTHSFLTSLVFTCVVETLVLWVLVRFACGRKDIPLGDVLFAGLFASFATITYVWYVFPVMVPKGIAPTLLSEPFAFIVEAIFYRFVLRLSWRDAFMVSFLANAASFIGGRALRVAGLWPVW